jgi:hypothetical protein
MSKLLEKAASHAATLPELKQDRLLLWVVDILVENAAKLPESQQDRLAQWIIEELVEQKHWGVRRQDFATAYSDNEPEYLISDILNDDLTLKTTL